MKPDYQKTIDILKENNLIKEGDKYAVCWFKPETQAGVFTTTTITSTVDYIIIANVDKLKLLQINRKTGEYDGDCLIFNKEDITFEKRARDRRFIWASRTMLGQRTIGIRFIADGFNHIYILPNKMHGFEQKEKVIELYDFVKDVYNTYYTEKEKAFKGKN